MSTLWILGKSFPRDTQKWKEALLMWLEVALADWETAWQNANSLSPVCCTKWHFRGKGRGGVSDSLCPQRVAAICDQRFIPIKSEVVSSTSFELGKDSEIFPIWIPPLPPNPNFRVSDSFACLFLKWNCRNFLKETFRNFSWLPFLFLNSGHGQVVVTVFSFIMSFPPYIFNVHVSSLPIWRTPSNVHC